MFQILIFISIVGVVAVILEIIRVRKCPEDTQLKNALLNNKKVRDKERERIITHIGTCQKCKDRADILIKESLS